MEGWHSTKLAESALLGKVHRGEDARAGFWGMIRCLLRSNSCNCFHLFWLCLQQMHILTPSTPPITLWDGYYVCHSWNPLESHLLSVWTSGWFGFRKWSYSVIWFVKHVTVGLWMHGQWNPWTCMHCPSLEAGALAHSLRCSRPRWRGPLPNAVPGERLHVLIILSSAYHLERPPLHDQLNCVVLTITQMPVCPLPSLIPHPLDWCRNWGTWSLRWICDRVRQECRSPDCLPIESWALRDRDCDVLTTQYP